MMSKKILTKLLAFTMSAGMILQPVAAYAQEADEENIEEIILEEAEEIDIEDIADEEVPEDIVVEDAEFEAEDDELPEEPENTNFTIIEATSNIADILVPGETAQHPTFTGPEQILFQDDQWLTIRYGNYSTLGRNYFGPGLYTYDVAISLKKEYQDTYKFDEDVKLIVDGEEWTRTQTARWGNGDILGMVFTSPEKWIGELPAFSKFQKDGDILTWDQFDGARGYAIKVGDVRGGISNNVLDFADACRGLGIPYGEYDVEVAAVDSNGYLISQFSKTRMPGNSEEPEEPEEPEDPENITGGTWYTVRGVTYYETKDGQRVTGRQTIDGENYFFDESGALQRNLFYTKDGATYYYGNDGKMAKGWLERYIGTYYFDENGAMQTGFVEIGDDTYYFNENGHQMKSYWVYEGTKTYYIKADGTMAKSESIRRWGRKYTFDAGGVLID